MATCALTTLGCKVNQCETDALAVLLRQAGYTVIGFDEKADVYVVNTCCVTAEGERKSRQTVHRAKERNPEALVVVTGCAAQRAPEEFYGIPGVLLAGTRDKQKIVALIENRHSEISPVKDPLPYPELPDAFEGERTRAFVKIQDGCNCFCSYCIIPYVRGREVSRSPESLKRQAEGLAERGYREIVLNGIHLSSYGREWAQVSLADAVEIAAMPEGIRRVRLGSLEEHIITPEFLGRVFRVPEFCHHFHLSLQSGSNTVLKRMNRRYTAEEFLRAVDLIRSRDPLAAISTDVIAGFPGETEAEFEETLAFVRRARFAWVHVFPYSRREGTAAAGMPGQHTRGEKAARAARLGELCGSLSRDYRQQFVGTEQEILCESWADGVQTGKTREHLEVCFGSDMPLTNRLIRIKITSVTENGLAGERTESHG